MQAAEVSVLSAEDYLAWEELQEDKYEYYQAEVFAMGGARREHVVASLNIASLLKQHLRGTPCQTYISDMKLRIEQVDAYFFPDVMVSCSAKDQQAEQFLTSPILIVEVLSASTEAFDRGDKFAAYRQLPSLKEYILVDIKARRVESYRRTDDNDWLLHISEGNSCCDMVSLECAIELADVFEDIAVSQQ